MAWPRRFLLAALAPLLSALALNGCSDEAAELSSAPASGPGSALDPVQAIANASELEAHLLRGQVRVALAPALVSGGCVPALCGPEQEEVFEVGERSDCSQPYCSTFVDSLEWLHEQAQWRLRDGRALDISVRGLGVVEDLDRRPHAAWRVSAPQAYWGLCMEFAHTGLARSGAAQRWVSVLLVPDAQGAGPASGALFTGLWAGCGALFLGPGPDEVTLPLVEPSGPGLQELVQQSYSCGPKGCEPSSSVGRSGKVDADGRLLLQ